jgi:ATP-dependent RNA helicase RhlE
MILETATLTHGLPKQDRSATKDDGRESGLWAVGSSFTSLGLDSRLVNAVEKLGLKTPTRIQAAGAGDIMAGKDVVLGAETGSGKTLAYLLPVLNVLLTRPMEEETATGKGRPVEDLPEVLTLVPNQELANQVLRVLDSLALGEDAKGIVVAGSQPYPRGSAYKIIIATPSGVLRHTDPELLSRVRMVVVDEADMLLDGGFVDDVEKILNELKPRVSKSAERRFRCVSVCMYTCVKISAVKMAAPHISYAS